MGVRSSHCGPVTIWGARRPPLPSLRVVLKKTARKRQEQKRGQFEPRGWNRTSPVRCLSPVSVGNLCLHLPAVSLASITKASLYFVSVNMMWGGEAQAFSQGKGERKQIPACPVWLNSSIFLWESLAAHSPLCFHPVEIWLIPSPHFC